jgi:signal transduction histidine kinase
MRTSKKQKTLLAVERLRASERLASEIAHELNTPLGGILMYSHLLLDDMNKGDPCRENVLKINKLAHRCKIILQGLLDFSNNDSLEMSPVDVNRILRDVIGFMEDHVLFRQISIQNRLDPTLPKVQGDESKLGQLFMNLIVNAGESMGGKGTLTLDTEFVPDRNEVRIACSDTGDGIADEHKGKIFEPFFTTKKRLKGTGLGLSISHGIVELHGGTITVESRRGRGSTFTIRLPAAEEHPTLMSDQAGTL